MTALDVVLVHGAWHGPWCWDRVVEELARRGIRAHAPALASTGPDPRHLGGFDDDVAAVHEALDRCGPAVVCGHSFAGLVIGAVRHPAVRRLVFLTAFMADEGENWSAVASEPEPTKLAAAVRADSYGNVLVDPDQAAACFYADCDPGDAAAAISRLQPQAVEPFGRSMPRPAWRSVPSTFVVCEQDQAISPSRQLAMAERAGEIRTLRTSHSPMLSRPDLVADILEGLARSTPPQPLTAPPDRATTVQSLIAGWEAFAELVEPLSGSAWDLPTRCPGWQVRDVAAHITGNAVDVAAGRAGTRTAEQQAAGHRHLAPAESAGRVREAARSVGPALGALDDGAWARPFGDMFSSLGEAVQTLLHDLYVHCDDIADALGRPPWRGPGLEAALATVTARLERNGWGRLAVPGDAHEFVLVATGRIPPERLGYDETVNIYRPVTARPVASS